MGLRPVPELAPDHVRRVGTWSHGSRRQPSCTAYTESSGATPSRSHDSFALTTMKGSRGHVHCVDDNRSPGACCAHAAIQRKAAPSGSRRRPARRGDDRPTRRAVAALRAAGSRRDAIGRAAGGDPRWARLRGTARGAAEQRRIGQRSPRLMRVRVRAGACQDVGIALLSDNVRRSRPFRMNLFVRSDTLIHGVRGWPPVVVGSHAPTAHAHAWTER